MARLEPCRDCESLVARTAETCPYCGADSPALGSWTYNSISIVKIMVVVVLVAWIFSN